MTQSQASTVALHVSRLGRLALMLQARTEHTGVTVADLIRRGRDAAELARRADEIRSDRRSAYPAIEKHAAAAGRTWTVEL